MIAFYILEFGLVLGLVGFLAWWVCRHNVLLFGRCTRLDERQGEYRFAIQNGEDVPVRAPLEIEIKVLRQDQGKIKGEPELLSGTRGADVRPTLRTDHCYRVRVDEIPPLETWLMVCRTNGNVDFISFTLRTAERGKLNFFRKILSFGTRRIKVSKQGQPAFQEINRVHMGIVSLALTLVLYLVPVFGYAGVWGGNYFTEFDFTLDSVILAVLVLGWAFSFYLCRRKMPPLIQGYLEWKS
jgi:hypothetical protein